MIRRIAPVLAAVALLLAVAAPVLAGGWADIIADAQTGTPPVEGRPIAIGFRVLQHGVTPAPWETATVHLTDGATGDAMDVASKNDRPDGHFTASVTLPHMGYWTWSVSLQSLVAQQSPVTITVRSTSGQLPPFDPATAMSAIDRAKADLRAELSSSFGSELQRLDGDAEGMRTRLASLDSQMTTLTRERDALQARVQALETDGGSVPILGIVSLAVLAGAAAGFAMSWLAGRPAPTPRVTFNPAPRGADPA
jgi:hypothetical protein